MSNECVMCGAEVPEGRQVCPKCESEINKMAKVVCDDCMQATEQKSCDRDMRDCTAYYDAELFHRNGYRKVSEGSVILTKEEYAELKQKAKAFERVESGAISYATAKDIETSARKGVLHALISLANNGVYRGRLNLEDVLFLFEEQYGIKP